MGALHVQKIITFRILFFLLSYEEVAFVLHEIQGRKCEVNREKAGYDI